MKVLINGTTWDKEAVHALLDRNDLAVARALMVIYNNQTQDEQSSHTTKHENGIGFTGRDAEWLTDIAKKWMRYGRWASARQCAAVRKSIKKYHRQILEHMAETVEGAEVLKGRQPKPVPAPEPALSDNPMFGQF